MGKIYLTKKQEQIIIDKYLQGASQKESGKAVGVGYKIVQRVLKENNISIRTQGESRTLYKVNNDFFKTQTREMAYILNEPNYPVECWLNVTYKLCKFN